MDFTILLLNQNMLMFLYLLIGWFLFRKNLIGTSGSADVGRMLLYIVMPAAILKTYMTSYSPERLTGLILSFLAALLSLILSIIISRIIFKKEQMIERFGAAFSNAGFIGIPLVQMTLGDEAVFYVSSFVALLNILQWTYGVLIPVLTIALLALFPAEYRTLKLAVLIAASAPVGSNVAIFAQLYGQDHTQAVKEVCLSTLFCIVTLPLITGLAEKILL